jgi:Fe-S oxidoreductase
VREYKGSHSGEHGDGLVRSEFHEQMFGSRLVRAFEEVKDRFDPKPLFNPGKIVRALKFDDRTNFRYSLDYGTADFTPALDWSAYAGGASGFQGAVEMCNNNGACRNDAGNVMCPSYRVTRDERDVTRGRANALRLAISGQLDDGAFTSDEMMETLKLCVSCKGCRRECPTGVDMARMKIEVLAARAAKQGYSLRDRLVGWLPRYAPYARRVGWLLNLRDALPGAAILSEWLTGFSAKRKLPKWRRDIFQEPATGRGNGGKEVVVFADTFNRYFERENLDAAVHVLEHAGYCIHFAKTGGRPLCCGRTFLSVGAVKQGREEAERTVAALKPFVESGMTVVGLEPSCIFGFRDEIPALLKGNSDAAALAGKVVLFEEFVAAETAAGRMKLDLKPVAEKALLHGHCHQKAFGAMTPVQQTLRLVPGLALETIDSSCCGMAGSFGYGKETIGVSLAMGELSLLPAIRKADRNTIIVADGTSCREQIGHGSGRVAIHVARVLAQSLRGERMG